MDIWTELSQPLIEQGLDKDFVPLIAFFLWQTWKSRNNFIFKKHILSFQEITSSIICYYQEIVSTQAMKEHPRSTNPRTIMGEEPPPPQWIKINFDGGTSKQQNLGSVVVIARDSSGNPCGWSCKRLLAMTDPLIVEVVACREAILLARAKDFDQIIIEGDATVVIQSLQGNTPPIEIKVVIADILELANGLHRISYCFIKKDYNTQAHNLTARPLYDASFTCNPLIQFSFVIGLMA
ncbi:hypothetical protein P3X46_012553 [Hevea brasiliensis]|uniref:RNase H type-1 domain-containing protein n=1 Tax=Hevea brasiliensis TaxID=3981 RepID=A0ABQ9MAK2_HEVBR|nr:hypothetical protein P3X46_012553 [Hevea brasiliensis]